MNNAFRKPIALVLLAFFAAGCGNREQFSADPDILPITSNYAFTFENWMQPRVWNLRRQEKLDDVIHGLSQDRQVFEALTLWSRRQFEPGFPDPYPLSNGISILEDIRSGKTKGFCGQYTYLLADALKSFGYFDVRYIEIWQDEKNSHFLLEAWDNQSGRWMLLDPLYAAIIVDGKGVPLDAWDLHKLVRTNKTAGCKRVWLAPESIVPRSPDQNYFPLFRHAAMSLRNDLAEQNHPWTIRERQRDFLLIENDAAEPNPIYGNRSGRMADFKDTRNLSWIQIEEQSDGYSVSLRNNGTCAHFDYFEVKVDDEAWKKVPEKFLLKRNFKTLSSRTINKMGMSGFPTTFAKS